MKKIKSDSLRKNKLTPVTPEAPNLVKNILWLMKNWKRYWFLVLITVLIFVGINYWKPIISLLDTKHDINVT